MVLMSHTSVLASHAGPVRTGLPSMPVATEPGNSKPAGTGAVTVQIDAPVGPFRFLVGESRLGQAAETAAVASGYPSPPMWTPIPKSSFVPPELYLSLHKIAPVAPLYLIVRTSQPVSAAHVFPFTTT